MRAEIISVGTELLLGAITDTNATWISQELQKIGLDLIYRTTVGDNEERIANALTIALNRVEVVIMSGGLGPTVDDVTREAIARAAGLPLEFHQELLDQVADRFKRFRTTMTDNNRRQAYAPAGATLIENPVGTAPIFILEVGPKAIMCLPGVPREMEYLFTYALRPWLQEFIGAPSAIHSVTLRTAGIGESVIDSMIDDLMKLTNPTVGLAAHSGQTDVRITAKAPTEFDAKQLIVPVEAEVTRRLGEWIYGIGDEQIENALARRLATAGIKVVIAESGTDRLLEKRLASAGAEFYTGEVPETLQIGKHSTLGDAALASSKTFLREQEAELGATILLTVDAAGTTEIAIAAVSPEQELSRSYSWGTPRPDGPIWVTTQCMSLLWRLIEGRADSKPD